MHQEDNTQTISNVCRVPDQHVKVSTDPQNIQDIWSNDDEENITSINKGMSTINVKVQIHTNIVTKAKSSIKLDQMETKNADDEEDDEDVEYFKQLSERCKAVDILIATKGFERSQFTSKSNKTGKLLYNSLDSTGVISRYIMKGCRTNSTCPGQEEGTM